MPTLHPDQFYGQGMLALFPEGSSPKTTPPFQAAGRRKDRPAFDQGVVTKALNAPPQLEEIDTRTLRATQSAVTRAGVAHYMAGGEYERRGETFANPEQAGNRYPVIYSRSPSTDERRQGASTQNLILSGHHRATAAHLEGRPLRGIRVRGGYGQPRQ